ncbi:MAG TPA: glycosyltransferase family 4 protein [Candidatus Limnocylindrales bacterium]|jgi:glycosyltransferase involved in cell wall biosynthesis|nr:glycosyltransferase family 4 protein [Candidatus Limnocylindrales bacterium]
MNILYLCPDLGIPVLGRKGASVHVRELARALGRAGHQITVAAQVLTKSPWEKPATFELPLVQVRPDAMASAAIQRLKQFNSTLGLENSLPGELRRILYNQELVNDLTRRFENDPPDFIYERASLYATAGVSLAKTFGVPLLLELNAPLSIEQTAYRSTGLGELALEAERWSLKGADALLVVSNALKKHALTVGVPEDKVHVLSNGVNNALFRPGKPDPNIREKMKLKGGPVLGFVGGLRPWHGVEILPDLLSHLNEPNRPVQLVIAGDGPLRPQLERDFKTRGLEKQVVFTGLVAHDEIPEIVRNFDIALAPYPPLDHDFYFSPLKLFEYMACGIPVVAANVGQIAEVLTDTKTGLLYPTGDLTGLTRCCEDLLQNPTLRDSIGAAGAELVSRQYTWDRNAACITELATSLIRAKSCSASPIC